MSTTAEIIAKLEAEAFDAEETARVWGGESQCAPPLRAAAARLSELERENARLRAALEPFARAARSIDVDPPGDHEPSHGRGSVTAGDLRRARAALAGSGEK